MILSLLVIAFLGFMVYWWGAQGAFSAFLHMMVIIVAGALAFGLWEPAAYFLLGTGSFATPFAWGLSLLSLFVLLLVPLRAAMDHLAPKNMDFGLPFNHVVGGVFGLVAGMVASGITILGFSYLPFSSSILGYQSYRIEHTSQQDRPRVVPNEGGLWVPVDRFTAGLYSYLSATSFSTNRPLHQYTPDLMKQAALFRMRTDLNGSVVAAPESVQIERVYVTPTPITQMPTLDPQVRAALLLDQPTPAADDDDLTSTDAGPADAAADDTGADASAPAPAAVANPNDKVGQMLLSDDHQLVLVDTKWAKTPGTFDADGQLRVPVTQVSLLAFDGEESHLHQPIAFIDQDHITRGEEFIEVREFRAVDNEAALAFSARQEPLFGWVFVIPQSQTPRFLNVRQTRFVLPEVTDKDDPADERLARMGASLGTIRSEDEVADAGDATQNQNTGNGAAQQGEYELEMTAKVPVMMSKNRSVKLKFTGPKDNLLLSGEELVEYSRPPGQAVRVTELYAPANLAVLRLKLTPQEAYTLFSRARNAAKRLQPIFLEDNVGEQWRPAGYILVHGSNRSQLVRIERDNPIQAGSELPLDSMREDDELYLYFIVRKGIVIERVKVGQETVMEPNLRVMEQP